MDYARANLLNLAIICYHYRMKAQLPFWAMFSNNLNCFNEEAGEVAFSALARCTVGDTQKYVHQHINQVWQSINLFQTTSDGFFIDLEEDQPTGRTSTTFVDPKGKDVQTVVSFLQLRLREMKSGTYTVYNSTSAYKSSVAAKVNSGLSLRPLHLRPVSRWVKTILQNMIGKVEGTWLTDVGVGFWTKNIDDNKGLRSEHSVESVDEDTSEQQADDADNDTLGDALVSDDVNQNGLQPQESEDEDHKHDNQEPSHRRSSASYSAGRSSLTRDTTRSVGLSSGSEETDLHMGVGRQPADEDKEEERDSNDEPLHHPQSDRSSYEGWFLEEVQHLPKRKRARAPRCSLDPVVDSSVIDDLVESD